MWPVTTTTTTTTTTTLLLKNRYYVFVGSYLYWYERNKQASSFILRKKGQDDVRIKENNEWTSKESR